MIRFLKAKLRVMQEEMDSVSAENNQLVITDIHLNDLLMFIKFQWIFSVLLINQIMLIPFLHLLIYCGRLGTAYSQCLRSQLKEVHGRVGLRPENNQPKSLRR